MAKKTDVEERQKRWAGVIGEWGSSGESREGFCRRLGIPLSTFGYWQKRMRTAGVSRKRQSDDGVSFSPVRIVGSKTGSAGLEIIVRDDVRIAVREDFNPDVLRAVVTALSL